jgi:hypothetical protein
MSDERGIAVQELPRITVALTAKELIARARVIDEVFQTVMKKDIHYGLIPGCGDKPALLKAGAEKLMATFGIASEIKITDGSMVDEIRYRVESRALSIANGAYLGSGVGECSTNEEKYRWRKAANEKEFEATPEDRKRIKWANGKTGPYAISQVRTNPADVANTVLKMATKRARIDMVLTVLGCSDMFQQDLDEEDVAERARETRSEQEAAGTTTKKPEKPKGETAVIFVLGVTEKSGVVQEGEKKGQKWTKHIVDAGNGVLYSTFSATHAEEAKKAQTAETAIEVTYTTTKHGHTITELKHVDRDPGAEG